MLLIRFTSGLKLIISFGLFALTFSANAQRYPATETDLRASYCLSRVKEISEFYRDPIPESHEKLNNADLDFLRTEKSKNLANLNRLQSYLLPRISYIDPNALLMAMNRYKADSMAIGQCMEKKQCMSYFQLLDKFKECSDACNIESGGARERIKQCYELNWLPF